METFIMETEEGQSRFLKIMLSQFLKMCLNFSKSVSISRNVSRFLEKCLNFS